MAEFLCVFPFHIYRSFHQRRSGCPNQKVTGVQAWKRVIKCNGKIHKKHACPFRHGFPHAMPVQPCTLIKYVNSGCIREVQQEQPFPVHPLQAFRFFRCPCPYVCQYFFRYADSGAPSWSGILFFPRHLHKSLSSLILPITGSSAAFPFMAFAAPKTASSGNASQASLAILKT